MNTKAFLKVVYRVTVDCHLSLPPPSTQKLALNTLLCTPHHKKHVIPIFCVGGHFRKILHARLPRSEDDSEKVKVRSEISTWRVVLAVTFGIFFGL